MWLIVMIFLGRVYVVDCYEMLWNVVYVVCMLGDVRCGVQGWKMGKAHSNYIYIHMLMDHSDYHDIMDHYWIIMDHWCRLFESIHGRSAMAGRSVYVCQARSAEKHWPYPDGCSGSWSEEQYQCVGSWGITRCLDGFLMGKPMVLRWLSHGETHGFPGKKMEKLQFWNLVHYRCLAECRNNCGAALVCCSQTLLSLRRSNETLW